MRRIIFSLALATSALFASASIALAASSPHINKAFYKQNGNVYLSWQQVEGAKYHIYYGPSQNQSEYAVEVFEGNMTIGHLFADTRYYFTVKAITPEGDTFSQTVSVWVGSDARGGSQVGHQTVKRQVTTKPYDYQSDDMIAHDTDLKDADISTGKPGIGAINLRTVNGPRSKEITLFWNEPSVADHGDYRIIYTTNPHAFPRGQWGVVAPSTATSYTIGYLQRGARYYFKVMTDRTESPWISDIAL